jgi:hypothetical protein
VLGYFWKKLADAPTAARQAIFLGTTEPRAARPGRGLPRGDVSRPRRFGRVNVGTCQRRRGAEAIFLGSTEPRAARLENPTARVMIVGQGELAVSIRGPCRSRGLSVILTVVR